MLSSMTVASQRHMGRSHGFDSEKQPHLVPPRGSLLQHKSFPSVGSIKLILSLLLFRATQNDINIDYSWRRSVTKGGTH